jgi:GxxExxY protein
MAKVAQLKRNDLVYPELSYAIVGCAYDVFNELGGGLKEKVYQNGMAVCFRIKKIKFTEQLPFQIKFKEETVGSRFLDFLVDDKIIVELKRGKHFTKGHFDQVMEYLKFSKLKLAILINFASDTVYFKRIVNLNEPIVHS